MTDYCQECGMLVSVTEYHPYAACVLFKHLHQGDKVRELIRSIQVDSSTRLQRAEELLKRWADSVHGYGPDAELIADTDAFRDERHD